MQPKCVRGDNKEKMIYENISYKIVDLDAILYITMGWYKVCRYFNTSELNYGWFAIISFTKKKLTLMFRVSGA